MNSYYQKAQEDLSYIERVLKEAPVGDNVILFETAYQKWTSIQDYLDTMKELDEEQAQFCYDVFSDMTLELQSMSCELYDRAKEIAEAENSAREAIREKNAVLGEDIKKGLSDSTTSLKDLFQNDTFKNIEAPESLNSKNLTETEILAEDVKSAAGILEKETKRYENISVKITHEAGQKNAGSLIAMAKQVGSFAKNVYDYAMQSIAKAKEAVKEINDYNREVRTIEREMVKAIEKDDIMRAKNPLEQLKYLDVSRYTQKEIESLGKQVDKLLHAQEKKMTELLEKAAAVEDKRDSVKEPEKTGMLSRLLQNKAKEDIDHLDQYNIHVDDIQARLDSIRGQIKHLDGVLGEKIKEKEDLTAEALRFNVLENKYIDEALAAKMETIFARQSIRGGKRAWHLNPIERAEAAVDAYVQIREEQAEARGRENFMDPLTFDRTEQSEGIFGGNIGYIGAVYEELSEMAEDIKKYKRALSTIDHKEQETPELE